MHTSKLSVIAAMSAGLLGCGGGGGGGGETPDAGPSADAPLAATPDQRFKGVGEYSMLTSTLETNVGPGGSIQRGGDGVFWSPLEMGGGSSWQVLLIQPTPSTQDTVAIAASGDGSDEPADLAALAGVITSLDFQAGVYGATAITGATPDPKLAVSYNSGVDDASFPALVAQQTGNGEIVTAFGFNGSAIESYAFSETGDANSYESVEIEATTDQLGSAATAIAGSGYTITAMGETSATSYGLVGTRIVGSASAHTIMVFADSPGSDDDLEAALATGYSVVGGWFDGSGGHFMLEK